MFKFGAELVDRLSRSFGDRLDRSIPEISNASEDARLSSGSNREISKAYALNSAPHDESLCRCHESVQCTVPC